MNTSFRISKIPDLIYSNLFDYKTQETRGDFYAFKFFELVVLWHTLQFAWEWGFYIQTIGDIVLPLGIAQHIDISFMFDHQISLINAGIMTIAGLAGFFRLNRYSYAICLLAFHLHYVSRYCLGEISHGSNLTGMGIFILALSQINFGNTANSRVFAIGAAHFFFGLGYTSAGICKLIGTGVFWVDGSHLWLWIGERSVDVLSIFGSFEFNLLQDWIMANHTFATMVLIFGILSELCAFLIWFRVTRIWSMFAVLGMHFGIHASMNILFHENMLIFFAIMYPWGRFIDPIINNKHRFLPAVFAKATG